MSALYNEIDPFAAAWLRNLIAAGHIAPGEVDERSIADVAADDLRGFRQVHLFAGIGGWSLGLRMAGWPDDRPVLTGSCPCPPFSVAGKGQTCPVCSGRHNLCHPARTGYFICLDCGHSRHADARHLWPEMSRIARGLEFDTIMGEQVASYDATLWLDAVSADLEGHDYAVRSADLPAAGLGSPHIRQRLWWRADRLADSDDARLEGRGRVPERPDQRPVGAGGVVGGLADADGGNAGAEGLQRGREHGLGPQDGGDVRSGDGRAWTDAGGGMRPGPTNGFWRDADWLGCRDDKWRPVEPGSFPLADGVSGRVGRLRAYGNAIVPEVAAAFIVATEAPETAA